MVNSLKHLIKEGIFSIFEEELKKETFTYIEYYLKNCSLEIENKKIEIYPLSYGFSSNDTLEGEVVSLETVKPGYALKEELKDKILFIKDLNQYHIKYLLEIKPTAVLTTSDIYKTIFTKDFPIFKTQFPFIGKEKIKITFRIKEEEEIVENYFYDFGLGSYFAYIHFPYDIRFQDENSISFYSSYLVIKDIVDRLVNVGHPKGYKVRVIFTENKYSDYIGLKKHLENQDTDKILSILNIDSCGLGNEKLITISNKRKIIDSFHKEKVSNLMRELGYKTKKEELMENLDLSGINVPFVWFFSQPNLHMYSLKKEFLDERKPVEFSSNLFYLINNMYKEMI